MDEDTNLALVKSDAIKATMKTEGWALIRSMFEEEIAELDRISATRFDRTRLDTIGTQILIQDGARQILEAFLKRLDTFISLSSEYVTLQNRSDDNPIITSKED
jgi:hypothetical protein